MGTKRYGFGTGTISLITLLMALLLCALSALGLSSAKNTAAYARRATEKNEAYLAADLKGQELLAAAQTALQSGAPLPQGCEREQNTLTFTVPAGALLQLCAKAEITAEGLCVTEWALTPTEEWAPQRSGGGLWPGEE